MNYKPSWWLRNGHFQSIYPSLFRQVDESLFTRTRIDTPDDDFLDLDWSINGNRRIVVITHGLEGHSRRPYVLGMANAAKANQWDVLAWNFRSCSGEPNKKPTSYHSGQTHDLKLVVDQAAAQGYEEIALIGFSIGGNKTLLYLAKEQNEHPDNVIGAVAFSVPLELSKSSAQLAKPINRIYMLNFLKSFKEKFEQKNQLMGNTYNMNGYRKIKTFAEFDGRYTAPMNGFASADDYWRYSSSLYQLKYIKTPTLLVNAKDDPFLTPECFPQEILRDHPYLQLETPDYGGHVGFMPEANSQEYWSELRAFNYLNSLSEV